MIRFVADGKDGKVLGLGLSWANLDLLLDDHPIVFALDELGASGELMIVAAESPFGTHLLQSTAVEHVLGLADSTLETLRQGQLHMLPGEALDLEEFAHVGLFGGPSELEIVDALKQTGLLAADQALEGMDEYLAHEAHSVEGCSWCALRAAEGHAPRKRQRQSPTSAHPLRDWVFAHPYTFFVAALLIIALFGLVIDALFDPTGPRTDVRRGEKQVARLTPEEVDAYVESEALRRAAITGPEPIALSEAAAPCTARLPRLHQDPKNAPPRPKTIHRGSLREDFDDTWEVESIFSPHFEIRPAEPEGVGPIHKVYRDRGLDGALPAFPYDTHVTYIVEAWSDPVLPDDLAAKMAALGDDAAETVEFTPGGVAGRVVVWSYPKRAFVCASPTVLTHASDLTIVKRNEGGRVVQDEPMVRAQIELLEAGIRAAMKQAVAVTPGPKDPEAPTPAL